MKRPGAERLAFAAYAWLAVFFLAPLALVFKLSLSHTALALPPYAPQLHLGDGLPGLLAFVRALDFDAYGRFVRDRIYLDAYLSSLGYAAVATGVLLAVGYPLALAMARAPRRWRPLLVGAVTLPFWTSFLIRIYAWTAILGPAGLLGSDAAIYIGLTYAYLPFMVLPLYAVLEREDETLREAAADLGATPWSAFWTVTAPLSLPGAAAGALLCFIPMVGEFVIPDLLGGPRTLMIGKLIWTEFFANRDWPAACAAAMALVATLALPIALYRRLERRR
ncbi:MAG TPA: ABC transporter permease [Caulobacteraceae bacterium]|jgi:putrescine transport system permease protein|nr:ABC transporter permease [Caulobacteraceae bacterium]